MADPIIYGAGYSTYVRTVRMTLQEKDIAYKLVEVDLFSGESQRPEHLARQPFGKIPAFEHDGFALYETTAIVRYIDDMFAAPPLQPSEPHLRARMNQIMAINDNYAYGSLVGTILIQRVIQPKMGGTPDEKAISAAVPAGLMAFQEINRLLGNQMYLAGDSLSLADLALIPVYEYALATPEGSDIVGGVPGLQRWWSNIRTRQSVVDTRPSLG